MYRLLEDGDRILIALSGGKDSLELVRQLSARAKIFRPSIHVEAAHVIMDNISYETDRTTLRNYCVEAGIELHFLHSCFHKSADSKKSTCFLCSWNRRKTLFEFAVNNGFNKIALGHHMDDILVTLLINLTFEGSVSTMVPSLRLNHYPLTIIRPLCLVQEADIRRVAEDDGFCGQNVPCPYEDKTRRATMAELFRQLETINPEARYSMWHAIDKYAKKD